MLAKLLKGREVPANKPPSMSSGLKRPETLQEQIRRLVRAESNRAVLEGNESFEESEDFDVDDEVDPRSQFEEMFDPLLGKSVTFDEWRRNEQIYRRQYEENAKKELKQESFWRRLKKAVQREDEAPATPPAAPSEKGSKGGAERV